MASQNESIAKAASTMHSLYQNNYVYAECWQREEHERIQRSLWNGGKKEGKEKEQLQLLKEFHLNENDEND